MPVSLTRAFTFSAAHRYRRPEWDDARNSATFGKCARPQWHGHTYQCEVSVGGPVDPLTGFCCDLVRLDDAVAVLRERLDHSNLVTDIPVFAEGAKIPTTEELAAYIAAEVQGMLGGAATVETVRVAEEPTLWATWRRA